MKMKTLNSGVLKLLGVIVLGTMGAAGCDWSAYPDLRRAEKVLKEADRLDAERWAEPEYRKAQKAFVEAMDLAKVRFVNEARDKAREAKEWAEEAIELTKFRQAQMEKEKERLGTYTE